jgi:outer membrane protein assembly factor BamB
MNSDEFKMKALIVISLECTKQARSILTTHGNMSHTSAATMNATTYDITYAISSVMTGGTYDGTASIVTNDTTTTLAFNHTTLGDVKIQIASNDIFKSLKRKFDANSDDDSESDSYSLAKLNNAKRVFHELITTHNFTDKGYLPTYSLSPFVDKADVLELMERYTIDTDNRVVRARQGCAFLKGLPLNPNGRTGKCGIGNNVKYGLNPVTKLVLRKSDTNVMLQRLANGKLTIPHGDVKELFHGDIDASVKVEDYIPEDIIENLNMHSRLSSNTLVISVSRGAFSAWDVENGKLAWSTPIGHSVSVNAKFVAKVYNRTRKVVVITDMTHFHVIDAASGHRLWMRTLHDDYNDFLYLPMTDTIWLYGDNDCLVQSDAYCTMYHSRDFVTVDMILCARMLICATNDMRIVAIDTETMENVQFLDVPGCSRDTNALIQLEKLWGDMFVFCYGKHIVGVKCSIRKDDVRMKIVWKTQMMTEVQTMTACSEFVLCCSEGMMVMLDQDGRSQWIETYENGVALSKKLQHGFIKGSYSNASDIVAWASQGMKEIFIRRAESGFLLSTTKRDFDNAVAIVSLDKTHLENLFDKINMSGLQYRLTPAPTDTDNAFCGTQWIEAKVPTQMDAMTLTSNYKWYCVHGEFYDDLDCEDDKQVLKRIQEETMVQKAIEDVPTDGESEDDD